MVHVVARRAEGLHVTGCAREQRVRGSTKITGRTARTIAMFRWSDFLIFGLVGIPVTKMSAGHVVLLVIVGVLLLQIGRL